MITDFVTLGTVSYSRRPPNKKWIYGYGKLETVRFVLFIHYRWLVWLYQVFLLELREVFLFTYLLKAFLLIIPLHHAYETFSSLYLSPADIVETAVAVHAHTHSHELIMHSSNNVLNGLGVGVLLASVGMKEWLYQQTMKIAKSTDSSVLKANAWHHRVDALSAVVALVGLSGRVVIRILPYV